MTTTARAVAAFGLRTHHEIGDLPADNDAFVALLGECEFHRLLGLFGAAIRKGALEVDEEQRTQVERRLRGWLGHDLRVERMLLDAVTALDQAHIDSRVLKGVALARTAYDDPADRVFGDVDLLVPGNQLTHAADVLARALDGERALPELRPGFDDRFGKEVMLRVHGMELDLHRTFVEGAYGLAVQLDDLFAPPYRFPVGATELEALPMPQRLLHACYAAAFGDSPPRLMSLRDVAQIVLREKPNLVDVLLMARSWKCEAVVARAVTLTWDTLALTDRPPIVEWARNFVPSAHDRRMVAWHEGPSRAFTRQAAGVLVIPGIGAKAAYLRAIAFPQRSYLAARGFDERGHVRRAVHRILH